MDQGRFRRTNEEHTSEQGKYGENRKSPKDNSWVCPECETINMENTCINCGYEKESSNDSSGHQNRWIKITVALLLVIIVAVCMSMGENADFDWSSKVYTVQIKLAGQTAKHTHSFSEATCTEAKTCSVCGITEGSPLEHDFTDPTCTSSGTCKRCGITSGKTLSHHWLSATYDAPATCELCGVTRGSVKGYYQTWYGYRADKKVDISGTNTYPRIFAPPISNCKKFTMHFQIVSVEYGKVFGEFKLYCKNSAGKWEKIGSFDVHDQSEVIKTFEFSDPISFTQLAVVAPQRGSFSYNSKLWFEDWYLQN